VKAILPRIAWSLCALCATLQPASSDELDRALELGTESRDAALRSLTVIAAKSPHLLVDRLDTQIRRGSDGLAAGNDASLLAEVLSDLSSASLIRLLEPTPDLPVDVRVARMTVLRHGDEQLALDLAVRLAETADLSEAPVTGLRSVATAIHRNAPSTARGLVRQVRECELTLAEPLARALADVDHPQTMHHLGSLLGAHTELDSFLLSRIAASARPMTEWSTCAAVIDCLEHDSAEIRREAITAVARFETFDAVPRLIELLNDEHAGVRANAHWALKHLSHLELPPDSLRWQTWFEVNDRWYRERWLNLRAILGVGNRQATTDALHEIAGRSYRRNELARGVASVLERSDEAQLLVYATLTLSSLRSVTSARAALPLLEDPRASVRDTAHACLQQLTGLSLPPDPALWSEQLPETTPDS
jgi:hypothetical protein